MAQALAQQRAEAAAGMSFDAAHQHYNQLASQYYFSCAHHASDVDDFVAKLQLQPEESLLDLGTGTGWVVRAALAHCNFAMGVDASEQCLQVAQSSIMTLDSAIGTATFALCDIRDEHWLRNTVLDEECPPSVHGTKFDVISLFWVLDHVPATEHQSFLHMLRRSFLKPGGRLVLTKSDPEFRWQTVEVVSGWQKAGQVGLVEAPISTDLKRWVGDSNYYLAALDRISAIGASAGYTFVSATPSPSPESGEYQDHTAQVAMEAAQLLIQHPNVGDEDLKQLARQAMEARLVHEMENSHIAPVTKVKTNAHGQYLRWIARAQHKYAGALVVFRNGD